MFKELKKRWLRWRRGYDKVYAVSPERSESLEWVLQGNPSLVVAVKGKRIVADYNGLPASALMWTLRKLAEGDEYFTTDLTNLVIDLNTKKKEEEV